MNAIVISSQFSMSKCKKQLIWEKHIQAINERKKVPSTQQG